MANNRIGIDIETNDKAGLSKVAAAYRSQGHQIGQELARSLGSPFEEVERKSRSTSSKMSGAVRGAVNQMTNELNKLERSAALSGDGMSSEYAAALASIRHDLERVRAAGDRTGAGLEGDLGDALRSIKRDMDALKPATAGVDRAFSETGRNVARMLDRIEIEAHRAGDDIGRSMSEAARSMRADLERVEAQARKTGGRLDSEIGSALKQIQRDAQKTKSELEDALNPKILDDGGGFADRLTESLSGGMDFSSLLGQAAWAGPAAAAGAGIGALMWNGLQQEWAEDRVGALISAQTGAASGSSERLGDTAGNIFAANFGDSIEQVGEAITAVFQNSLVDTSAPEDAVERITKKVLTLQATTGEAANDISRAARQLLVTGLADNMTAAMDMIQHATELGLNTTDELLDTIEEYSTEFRSLGLSGQEAFGLIDQAIVGGARNVDIAADALKEFQIRGQDMSDTTKRGFETLGLNADVMGQKVAAGGGQAREALREVLNQLQGMPPSLERNSAAVDLFGTKAEDLGNALFAMDLDTASDKFGEFGGSVEEASQKISEGVSTWDKVGKGISNLANGIGEAIGNINDDSLVGQLNGMFSQLELAKEQFLSTGDTTWLDEVRDKYPAMSSAVDEFIEAKRGEVEANQESNSGYTELIETMDSYLGKLQEAADTALGLHDSQRAYQQALDDGAEAIDDYGKKAKATGEGLLANRDGFDRATESGRKMEEALDDIASGALKAADYMDANGESITDVNKHMADARTRFINTATAMGLSSAAANRLADELKLIPRKVTTTVELRDSAAKANLRALKRAIDNIPRTITVSTYVRGANIAPGGGGGHMFLGQARGGISTTIGQAQTGGQRLGTTLLNEAGPEIADLPNGSRVATAGATRAMLESGLVTLGPGSGGGAAPTRVVKLVSDGSEFSDLIIKTIRRAVSDEGGDVQLVLGRSS